MADLIPKDGGYRKLKSFQIARLAADFETEGGFSEHLYRTRKENRKSTRLTISNTNK